MATGTAKGGTRPERGGATRDLILRTAERLFAERGVAAVSNRQISEAAGQGNSAAVGYHFGAKIDLVRAIARAHAERIEWHRVHLVADAFGSTDVRDWVVCLVRPVTAHLADLGTPSWWARFGAQLATDPELHRITAEESAGSPSLRLLVEGMRRCVPDLPDDVRAQRGAMGRHLIVHLCAERERDIAEGRADPASWDDLSTSLTDAIVGLWSAPVTRRAPHG
ncbi:TetR/AcrR family transcriptional regulator [Actinocorallia sp. API 0066]|uniref:TetR/AcrR family transcriptional regulator n=1 Tax=Actinocorallia sp. API 0066 TaxID=2896846 RepID=UPI001E5DA25C|nr:TetR/AcrR family transcriptional regulator [Actinocorallia sp. API 0066]MCD0451671.1 TetR/AcrR family transcriptional regulator [Actinocorallia sp. API 0066]